MDDDDTPHISEKTSQSRLERLDYAVDAIRGDLRRLAEHQRDTADAVQRKVDESLSETQTEEKAELRRRSRIFGVWTAIAIAFSGGVVGDYTDFLEQGLFENPTPVVQTLSAVTSGPVVKPLQVADPDPARRSSSLSFENCLDKIPNLFPVLAGHEPDVAPVVTGDVRQTTAVFSYNTVAQEPEVVCQEIITSNGRFANILSARGL